MKFFLIALVLLSLCATSYAMDRSTMDLYANMGLMYAQSSLGLKPECFGSLQNAYTLVMEAYKAFTESNMGEIIGLITKGQALVKDIMTNCIE